MMDYLSHNIAENVKRARLAKGMSLDVAMEQTGVSKSMLYHIEKGDANPSISVLGKIASGLRIQLVDLISPPKEDTCLVHISEIVPTKEIPGQYSVRTCFPYEDNQKVEIYRIDLEPGGSYTSGGHGENTREYIAVLTGSVVIKVDDVVQTISPKEMFRFQTEHTHTYCNPTEETASLLCIFVA